MECSVHILRRPCLIQHFFNYDFQLCGAITPEVWPGVENLDLYNKMELPKGSKRRVKERLKHYVKDPYACDLIGKFIEQDSLINEVPCLSIL